MYVVQRYLDPDALNRAGLTDFDSWAATFVKSSPAPNWQWPAAAGSR